MATGPGKYDAQATLVRESTNADAVIVIVFGGDQGSGFSVQASDPRFDSKLQRILREVAAQIERDLINANREV